MPSVLGPLALLVTHTVAKLPFDPLTDDMSHGE